MQSKLRQALLKPLVRRQRNSIDEEAILSAYKRLDNRALGIDLLRDLRDVIKDLGKKKSERKHASLHEVKKRVSIAKALYLSRSITISEYVYFAVHPIEGIFDHRC